MTPKEAVEMLEKHMPFNVLVEHYYEAWQTLKSAVLAQRPDNNRYATALEVLTSYRYENFNDIYDYSAFRRYCAEHLHSAKAQNDA
jgi:hypothetical protein